MSKTQQPTIYETVTNRIIETLEAGTIPWTRPWKSSAPRNGETKREYRGINKVLLWLVAQENGYESTGWVTYRQAQLLGGQVRRGARATPVIWWSKKTISNVGLNDDEPQIFWIARFYYVFNLQQIDGLDLLRTSLDKPDFDFHPIYRCEQVIKQYGADIRHAGNEAFYSPSGDFIQLPVPSSFVSRESYYATLAHELVHHSGSAQRLGRDLSGRFGSTPYAREELIAELGSAFITSRLGVPHETRATSAYIQMWLRVLREDKRAVFTAATQAQRASDFIVGEDDHRSTEVDCALVCEREATEGLDSHY